MMRKRIVYSQNFIKDKRLVADLLEKIALTSDDVVIEIGAGSGMITELLLKRVKKLIAHEIDQNLTNKLAKRFRGNKNFELISGDFLASKLPQHPYKVFSNLPFNQTSAIVKKLLFSENPPQSCHLIIQKEAAEKFAGMPLATKNSLLAALFYPWFEFEIKHHFSQADFVPQPEVEVVFLEIKKRDQGLIANKNKSQYQDFVCFGFSQTKPNVTRGLLKVLGKGTILALAKEHQFFPNSKPSGLESKYWINLYQAFLKIPKAKQKNVHNSFSKLLKQQEKLDKIHRTRTDKNWKEYQ